MMRIAHIIQDEKFPDSAYEAFEEVIPGCSDYFLPVNEKKQKLRYLNKIKPIRIHRLAFFNPLFIKRLENYDAVLFHGLTEFCKNVAFRNKGRMKLIWIGMGYDYYDLIHSNPEYLLKHNTKEIARELNKDQKKEILIHPNTIKYRLKRIVRRYIWKCEGKKLDSIKNIAYFAPVLESEYVKLKSIFPNIINGYIDWNYGSTARLIDGQSGINDVSGNNVLVGNSASFTNNHVEAFRMLEKILPNNTKKIVVPLSYGNSKYRDFIISYGKPIFGKNFFPIKDFMPFDNYMEIISSCSNVIMNHKRQQAVGNIDSALYMGARVFLDPENLVYQEYYNKGIFINSISELERTPSLLEIPLTPAQKSNNKEMIRNMRGWHTSIRKTEGLVELIRKQT